MAPSPLPHSSLQRPSILENNHLVELGKRLETEHSRKEPGKGKDDFSLETGARFLPSLGVCGVLISSKDRNNVTVYATLNLHC